MMALEARDRGECTLIAVMAPGRTLRINAVTQRTGWVKVSVVGVENRSIADCVPIVGDQPWTRVRWNTGEDMTSAEGQPVTLRFELNQAKVFGLQFE